MRGDEACSQVFVNQLSALPCQTPHCSYSTSASIIILNFLGEFVVSGPKAVKVTNKSWQRTLFSPSLLISLETSTPWRPFKTPKYWFETDSFCHHIFAEHKDIGPQWSPYLPAGTLCAGPACRALAQNQYLSRLVNLLAGARPSKWSSALNLGRQG